MDVPVLTSLIAAGVSLASVAANYFIAQRSHLANLEALVLKAKLDDQSLATKLLKELETQGERLRMLAAEILSSLERCDVGQSRHSSLTLTNRLREDIDLFWKQAELFWESWAPAKPEIPLNSQRRIRELRHRCKATLSTIKVSLEALEGRGHEYLDETTKTELLVAGLRDLIAQLESFTGAVSTFRLELGNSLMKVG